MTCFDDFQIAHYRENEGYSDNWFDMEGDDGRDRSYFFKIPEKNGDLYFTVDSYYQGTVPDNCWGGNYPKY